MNIVEEIRSKQNIKEMTRRAIIILKECGENTEKEEKEFLLAYGENVDNKPI